MSVATIPFIPAPPRYPAAPTESPTNPAATIYLELSHRAPGQSRKARFLSFAIHGTDDSAMHLAAALQRLSERFCGRCSARREACQCADGPVAPVESL